MAEKKTQSQSKYHPLYYLSSLGAGGLTVAFWKLADVTHPTILTTLGQAVFYLLALGLFLINLPYWIRALKNTDKFFGIELPPQYSRRRAKKWPPQSPVSSTGWMAMPAAFAMLLNATFVVLPEFFGLSAKAMAPIGFWAWLVVYAITFVLGFQILFNTFAYTASLESFHFGLFLQPLTYGLAAVPGVSMAGMLPETMGDIALLLGLTAFGVGGIVGSLALIFIFQRFMTYGFPEPSVAPTSLLLMPSITVYTIFVLKLMHYMGHHGMTIAPVFLKVLTFTAIGFMGAAATLGLIVLLVYFREHVPFGPSWWSFVCPFVALSVLSSITYQFGDHLGIFLGSAILALTVVTLIYIYVGVTTLKHLLKS